MTLGAFGDVELSGGRGFVLRAINGFVWPSTAEKGNCQKKKVNHRTEMTTDEGGVRKSFQQIPTFTSIEAGSMRSVLNLCPSVSIYG